MAQHAAHEADLEAVRQRLVLLGLTPERLGGLRAPGQIASEILVPAPIDGVITARSVNLDQVAAVGQELFTVTDLSSVWVVGDLYEQDFQTVRVGSDAAVTTQAYPGLVTRGRVTYIDPRVDPQTRTAKVRVEVPNPAGRLRLGMFATMAFTTPRGEPAMMVPRAAVQAIGDRQIVFVAAPDEDGKFVDGPAGEPHGRRVSRPRRPQAGGRGGHRGQLLPACRGAEELVIWVPEQPRHRSRLAGTSLG